MDIISDMPEMPECILETSTDVFEVLAHNWTNCTKCLYEHARKMSNNQEILFDDRKPFWVVEREQRQAELAAIQQQEAERLKREEAERKKQLAAEQAAEKESSKAQKKKKNRKKGKKGAEEDSPEPPASAETPPTTTVKHVCYTNMSLQARHHAMQQLIKSGKATSKNEAKWQLIRLCTDQCRKTEETEVVEKDKVPVNKMPWVSQFKYPKRVSTLTKALHKRYVAIKLSQAKGGPGRFGHQGSEIHELDEKLVQERAEFNKFVLEWMEKKGSRYENLPGSALRFLINRTKALLEQLYGVYSVRPACTVPLASVDVLNVKLWWPRVVTPLVELGTPPTLTIPNLHRKTVFDLGVHRLLAEYPHDTASVSSVDSDETAAKLARKHGARFVMSAATARLLLLQIPFNRPPHWDIPIVVKKEFVQGRMQSVIYFCKALPVDGCNAMQLWWRYVKMALKCNLVHGCRSDSSTENPETQGDNPVEDEIFSDSADTQALDRLETFGVSSPKRKSISGEKGATPAETDQQQSSLQEEGGAVSDRSRSPSPQLPASAVARIPKRRTRAQTRAAKVARIESEKSDTIAEDSAESDIEQRLTIDVDEDEDKSGVETDTAAEPSPTTENNKSAASAEISSDPSTDLLDSIFSKMPKPQPKTTKSADRNDLQFVEDAADYDAPDNLRTMRRYVLAQINNCGPILIRSNVDGLADGAHVSFAPKIEYAPEHGAEAMSDDEWLWHWTTAMLKGSAQHLIVSVHYCDSHCLQIETSRAADWSETRLSDQRKFLIASRSKYMADLLGRVSQLDDGEYLLQRRADKDHIAVLQKVDYQLKTPEMLDLSEMGMDQRRWSKKGDLPPFEQRFLGVDPTKLLVWHRVLSRIPATFFPRMEGQKPNLTDGSSFSKKGKKGGNKWKWKKNKNKKKEASDDGANE